MGLGIPYARHGVAVLVMGPGGSSMSSTLTGRLPAALYFTDWIILGSIPLFHSKNLCFLPKIRVSFYHYTYN